MNKRRKLTAVMLVLALALCLLPVSALALEDAAEEPEETAQPEEIGELVAEAVHNGPESVLYTVETSVVYNNGGTVYNNGGLVYNNAGTVYNNAGTVYNNAGTVYANGGLVYNNAGVIYNNGAAMIDNAAATEAFQAAEPEETLDEENPEETPDAEIPEEDPEAEEPEEGPEAEEPEETMTEAPVFSLQPGTYGEEQYLELTAAEGAVIYFTDDGSEPEVGEGQYTGPIAIKEGAVIKAIAVAEGAQPSEVAEAAYAVVKIEGPEFADVKTGYIPETAALVVTNDGPVDAKVTSVELSGKDARQFYLSHSSGRKIPAGAAMASYWTVQPVAGLEKGTYTALLTVTLDSGETVELELSFQVAANKK